MTNKALLEHYRVREEKMKKFLAHPRQFKVCDLCQSIAYLRAATCPVCNAYRWRYSPEQVINVALLIGSNPFPITSGVVPRL